MPDSFASAIAACLAIGGGPPARALEDLVREVLERPERPGRAQLADMQERIERRLPGGRDRLALVYGGATKIKGYVFEAPSLPEIRGASALLDRINTIDLPRLWDDAGLRRDSIVYASGGNLLAFAPAHHAAELAAEIERTYARETLLANSVAVSATFQLLEIGYGLRPLDYWVEQFRDHWADPDLRRLLESYYGGEPGEVPDARFFRRKTFGELVTYLATLAGRRRESLGEAEADGNPLRRDIPHDQLQPWAARCATSGIRSAVVQVPTPDQPLLSEASARKLYVGQQVKRPGAALDWYERAFGHEGAPELPLPWESRFLPEQPLASAPGISRWEREVWAEEHRASAYYQRIEQLRAEGRLREQGDRVLSARDVGEIGQASRPERYIGLIYADGNSVGRAIARAGTPEDYAALSRGLGDAAHCAVFRALARHLRPAEVFLQGDDQPQPERRWVHPFEILTIGGDDLLLIVPGSAAIEIALTIGYEFERFMRRREPDQPRVLAGRYQAPPPDDGRDFAGYTPWIGLSAGVLIAQARAPIFFLRDLAEELLRSAKRQAGRHADGGGAVDFMALKSIAMVSDDIAAFRAAALGTGPESDMRLTGRPFSWPELQGLLATARALREVGFPRSQIARLRQRLLDARHEGGITPSAIDYLYTRASGLKPRASDRLARAFDFAWHSIGRSDVAPWIYRPAEATSRDGRRPAVAGYETIWPDLAEIYDFVQRDQ
ncbi:MAG: hydrolase [Kouleothrix sp.]|nr:hydrolase [Kouleothrix sp.]